MRIDLPAVQHARLAANNTAESTTFKARYDALLNEPNSAFLTDTTIDFLQQQLAETDLPDQAMPTNQYGLLNWLMNNALHVGQQYQQYLAERRNGAPRKYFSNKSHALFFIKTVAPTKMVDGAWLYGFTKHYKTERFAGLINTYLEELGDGVQEKNHVSLYKKLLRTYGLNSSDELDDRYYQQGAIQLALGRCTDQFMPEAIGFNLGYEQLPLHLLITAYELKELGIDPYYFTLHVTIDNAYTGHAKTAVHAVLDNVPALGDVKDYFARVSRGLQLNNLGAGTEAIIADFDLEQEFISIIQNKASIGKYMHANQCIIAGRSINDWLADSGNVPQFIAALQAEGWIRRHQDPTESRFWKLIENTKAMMFGVFSPYEKQVIFDWIAGDYAGSVKQNFTDSAKVITPVEKDIRQNHITETEMKHATCPMNNHVNNIVQIRASQNVAAEQRSTPKLMSDWDGDAQLFQQKIDSCADQSQLMQLYFAWMTPARHHTPIGLKATQLFKEQLDKSQLDVTEMQF